MVLRSPFSLDSKGRTEAVFADEGLPTLRVRVLDKGLDLEDRRHYEVVVLVPGGRPHKFPVSSGFRRAKKPAKLRDGFAAGLAFLGAAGESWRWHESQGRKPGEDSSAAVFPPRVARLAALHYEKIRDVVTYLNDDPSLLDDDGS